MATTERPARQLRFEVTCPNCNDTRPWKKDLMGRVGRCGNCRQTFRLRPDEAGGGIGLKHDPTDEDEDKATPTAKGLADQLNETADEMGLDQMVAESQAVRLSKPGDPIQIVDDVIRPVPWDGKAPTTRPAEAESTTATRMTPGRPTRSPRTWGLQLTGAAMFMAGMAAAALGLAGPSDIQLLGFAAIGSSLVSGGIVVSAIARAIQVLGRPSL